MTALVESAEVQRRDTRKNRESSMTDHRRYLATLLASGVLAVAVSASAEDGPGASDAGSPNAGESVDGIVRASGTDLVVDGSRYRFAGTNNYYLMYGADGAGTQVNVTNVLDDARAAGFDAMRLWAFFLVQDPDEPGRASSIHGEGNSPTWFQGWDDEAGAPMINEGDHGLAQLDFAVAQAGARGIRSVLPFVGNWDAFGGIDQYVHWRDLADDSDRVWYHDDFYTDEIIKGWYKDWITYLLNRRNVYTDIAYKDDPNVLMWELANEPRCRGTALPSSPDACEPGNVGVITAWAEEMGAHVKSIDDKHLLGVGDEGWFCDQEDPRADDTREGWNCSNGIDAAALAALDEIDVVGMHLYPEHWGYDAEWGNEWIREHAALGTAVDKPTVLGEFGIESDPEAGVYRNPVYRQWLDTAYRTGVDGTLYWILSGKVADGTLYPDYDGFTVYCPSPVCTTIGNNAERTRTGVRVYPPVADVDFVQTGFDTGVTIDLLANDVGYVGYVGEKGGLKGGLMGDSVDLDPGTPGRQSTSVVAGGTFALDDAGIVTFAPQAGFSGFADVTYTVSDQRGSMSNEAGVTVRIRPEPAAAATLFSYEDGTQDWGADGITTSATTAFATDGAQSLEVDVPTGASAWVSGPFTESQDFSERSELTLDFEVGAGTSIAVSLQVGPDHTWCQSGFEYAEPDTSGTRTIDLATDMSCPITDFADVHQMNVFFNSGTHRLDNVVIR